MSRQVDAQEREEAKYDGNDREKVEPEGVLGDRSKGPVLCKDMSEACVNRTRENTDEASKSHV